MTSRARTSTKKQTSIAFRSWGGKRRGAGRKPKGARAGVSHATRAVLTGREPVLVTLKVKGDVWNLRARRAFLHIAHALARGCVRFGMRITHFSVQRDHAHLIVEAESRESLVRGIKGLCVRIARALNKMMKRSGAVFADRYHDRVLATPRQTRHAISYVLCNARKHGLAPRSARWVDPCSSGAAFDRWSREVDRLSLVAPPIASPRSWLLRVGWMRAGGPIDPGHCPGHAPA